MPVGKKTSTHQQRDTTNLHLFTGPWCHDLSSMWHMNQSLTWSVGQVNANQGQYPKWLCSLPWKCIRWMAIVGLGQWIGIEERDKKQNAAESWSLVSLSVILHVKNDNMRNNANMALLDRYLLPSSSSKTVVEKYELLCFSSRSKWAPKVPSLSSITSGPAAAAAAAPPQSKHVMCVPIALWLKRKVDRLCKRSTPVFFRWPPCRELSLSLYVSGQRTKPYLFALYSLFLLLYFFPQNAFRILLHLWEACGWSEGQWSG